MRIGGYWNERGYDSEAAFGHYSMGESIVGNGGGDDDKKKPQKQPLPIGDIGTGLGVIGEGLWFLGENKSADLYQQGFRRGIEGNYQLTGRNFSLFGNQTMTELTKPIADEMNSVSRYGRAASNVGTILSIGSLAAFDVPSYNEGSISASRLGYRITSTGVSWGVASFISGPYGALVGLGFAGLEKAYDWTEPARKDIVNSYGQFKRTLTSSWLKFK